MDLDYLRIRQPPANSVGHTSAFTYSSPFELVDNQPLPTHETVTSPSQTTTSIDDTDNSMSEAHEINKLLAQDLRNRITRSADSIAGYLFPDSDFGFPINDQFLANFRASFLTERFGIDTCNFTSEPSTSTFLNRMVSTISKFLCATKQTTLEPLRYFSALSATQAVAGHPAKQMPVIALLPLVDGHTLEGRINWCDVHAMVEHTQETKPPKRIAETVPVKSYMTFCAQLDRDFIPFLCITGQGFHIVLSDHVGHIYTDVIPFSRSSGTLTFLRMVMGFAFLPDNKIGLDTTMTRRQRGRSSKKKFCDEYPPFECKVEKASVQLLVPTSGVSRTTVSPDTITNSPLDAPATLNDPATGTPDDPPQYSGEEISSISIGSMEYPVIRLLSRSQALIGRATRAFLVRLPDGRRGVLKDSWITTGRCSEAEFLHGLEIPFGLQLVDACVLGDTGYFRSASDTTAVTKPREKRRIVTYPPGVHISDFSSLWELMAAMLDIVIAIMYLASKQKLHRDISYTNILLREVDDDFSEEASLKARKHVMDLLGLSEIESLRNELMCREGLLIDFDYAAALSVIESKLALDKGNRGDGGSVNAASSDGKVVREPSAPIPEAPKPSGTRTGTAPFIAIELLIYAVEHRIAHDLESLCYVLLFLCTHLKGPNGQVANPPLYGNIEGLEHTSVLSDWFTMNRFSTLGHLKCSHMTVHFESHVLPHISPYFYPLRKHLAAFWNALFPQRKTASILGRDAVESTATCQNIIQVLKEALLDPALINSARNTTRNGSILGKRLRPGDLGIAENGWDLVKLPRTTRTTQDILEGSSSNEVHGQWIGEQVTWSL